MSRVAIPVQEKMKLENPEFVEACQGLSVPELDNRLAALAKDAASVDQAREADEALAKAKEEASGLGAPYRDAKKAIKLKTKYVLELIGERS